MSSFEKLSFSQIRPIFKKGPRNDPVPRGAEKLNRFRERLAGNQILVYHQKPGSKRRLPPCCRDASSGVSLNSLAFRRANSTYGLFLGQVLFLSVKKERKRLPSFPGSR